MTILDQSHQSRLTKTQVGAADSNHLVRANLRKRPKKTKKKVIGDLNSEWVPQNLKVTFITVITSILTCARSKKILWVRIHLSASSQHHSHLPSHNPS